MNEKTHVVDTAWRQHDAMALEERTKAISNWLEHTDDLVDMFEDNEEVMTMLRSAAGNIRTCSNDYSDKAAKIRAELAEENVGPD